MQQEVTLWIRWQAVYFKRQDHNSTIWPPRSARGNVHAQRSTGSRLRFEWRGRNCCTRCRVINARKSTANSIHSSPNVSRSLVSAWSRSQPACLEWRWADIADFENLTQQEIEDEIERCSFMDDQAAESGSSPSLLDPRPVSPIHVSTNSSSQKQTINLPNPQKVWKKVRKTNAWADIRRRIYQCR